MLEEFNGTELKPRDGRVLDVILTSWQSGSIPTTSEVLDSVSMMDYNKQVLRCLDRLERAKLVRTYDGDEYEEFEWDMHIPAPTVVEPTPALLNWEDDLRLKPEEFDEDGTLSRQQLRRRVRELEETVEQMEETIDVLRGALGERKRVADNLEERLEEVEGTVDENGQRIDHVRNSLKDPEAYGIKQNFE